VDNSKTLYKTTH